MTRSNAPRSIARQVVPRALEPIAGSMPLRSVKAAATPRSASSKGRRRSVPASVGVASSRRSISVASAMASRSSICDSGSLLLAEPPPLRQRRAQRRELAAEECEVLKRPVVQVERDADSGGVRRNARAPPAVPTEPSSSEARSNARPRNAAERVREDAPEQRIAGTGEPCDRGARLAERADRQDRSSGPGCRRRGRGRRSDEPAWELPTVPGWPARSPARWSRSRRSRGAESRRAGSRWPAIASSSGDARSRGSARASSSALSASAPVSRAAELMSRRTTRAPAEPSVRPRRSLMPPLTHLRRRPPAFPLRLRIAHPARRVLLTTWLPPEIP